MRSSSNTLYFVDLPTASLILSLVLPQATGEYGVVVRTATEVIHLLAAIGPLTLHGHRLCVVCPFPVLLQSSCQLL